MNLSHRIDRSIRIERQGVRLNVRVSGSGSALLLLHGFTGSGASWDHLVAALSEQFLVVRPDALGHGLSDSPLEPARYEMPQAVADLAAIMDALEVERAGIHGYSMGGRTALYGALMLPERITTLSLESASPGLDDPSARQARRAADEALAQRIEDGGVSAFVNEWERLPLFETQSRLPADVFRAQREIRLGNSSVGLANSLRGLGTGAQPSLWDRLRELERPVMLLTGEKDAKFTQIADRMAETLPHAIRVNVADAGHSVYLEQPATWLSAIAEFHQSHQISI